MCSKFVLFFTCVLFRSFLVISLFFFGRFKYEFDVHFGFAAMVFECSGFTCFLMLRVYTYFVVVCFFVS